MLTKYTKQWKQILGLSEHISGIEPSIKNTLKLDLKVASFYGYTNCTFCLFFFRYVVSLTSKDVSFGHIFPNTISFLKRALIHPEVYKKVFVKVFGGTRRGIFSNKLSSPILKISFNKLRVFFYLIQHYLDIIAISRYNQSLPYRHQRCNFC